ncbi:nicotinamide riboside transporter PnuC [Entomoplasma freundtii]|uniref:Nicotinamide mononucleotide transporter PnuC n=1 Tax=Entomoplasma freundtii TaxID=74700 RepID=A0A2K8NRS9_9MOLU|nr:nicotinamide mononucleotide transporter [Entomoplasma freundtii]ATZ16487.1 nicotinamide mononucleotide transporter PnuC [Entomoplasma freundtii]TDY56016.1 nicotinamide riboside transporter PnuC [Entomoplasma freundtii]
MEVNNHHLSPTTKQKFSFRKSNFLGIFNAVADLKATKKSFKWFLLCGSIVILIFNFLSLNNEYGTMFLPLQKYRWALANDTVFGAAGNQKAATAVAILYSLSGITSITGLLAVGMIVTGATSQFFWQVIHSTFYGLFALSVGYVGDVLMNIILILGCPLGWFLFTFKGHSAIKNDRHSWGYNLWFALGIMIVTGLVVMMWYWAIPGAYEMIFNKDYQTISSSELHWLDALANGGNTIGYALQLVNSSAQFFVWFFVDILKFLKFTGIAPNTLSITMLIQFAIWFTTDFAGMYNHKFKFWLHPEIDASTIPNLKVNENTKPF